MAAEPNVAGRSRLGAFALSALCAAFSALRFNHKRILNENLIGNV